MSDKISNQGENSSINIKEELERENIKFLNINVSLVENNNPQLTFKNISYKYIESVELLGGEFKYEPFKERHDCKFQDIKIESKAPTTTPPQPQQPPQTQVATLNENTPVSVEKWDKGKWDNETGTFTLNKSFTRPGIYTGIIKVKRTYEKYPEHYIISFKKQPSDYIGYKDLIITATTITIEDLYVSDGYKCLRADNFDEITISYSKGNTITLKKDDIKKYLYNKNVPAASSSSTHALEATSIADSGLGDTCKGETETDTASISQSNSIEEKIFKLSLLELTGNSKLESNTKITIVVKYLDLYEVSSEILLLENELILEKENILVTNQPSNMLESGLKSAFAASTTSFSFPKFEANSTVKGEVNFGSYSVAVLEQTFGETSSVLGGAELKLTETSNTDKKSINI